MNLYTRTLKHIDMNRVKELHEKKVRTAAKKPKINEEVIVYSDSEFCNWREEIDLKESDWTPSSGSGPTNSSSQQFTYFTQNFQTGQPNTMNASVIGGDQESPNSVTVDFGFGEVGNVEGPSPSQYALQGYTPPLGKGVMKRNDDAEDLRKKQDKNLQKIKDTLKNLGTSWEEMRANNWALLKDDGTSIILEPITPGNKQLNWIDNSKITVGKKHRDAGPGQNPYKVTNPDGSITMEFSEIVSVETFQVNDNPINKQLDASQEFTQNVGADYMMDARVQDTIDGLIPNYTSTPDAPTDPNAVTPEDEAFIDYMERYPALVNFLLPGQAAAANSVIDYARGNYRNITQSPGRSANKSILNIISRIHKPGQRGGSVTAGLNPGGPPSNINTAYPTDPVNAVLDAPMRNFLNQFNYEVTSDGVRIIDTFNFNGNRNTGALGNIPIKGPDGRMVSIQDVASRLAEIGDKRARSMGLNPSDDSLGAKIDFTIPWSQVPPGLQNKLDPTATIIPTTKRGRRRRKGIQESTWKKLKKRRRS